MPIIIKKLKIYQKKKKIRKSLWWAANEGGKTNLMSFFLLRKVFLCVCSKIYCVNGLCGGQHARILERPVARRRRRGRSQSAKHFVRGDARQSMLAAAAAARLISMLLHCNSCFKN